jgi:hypothetical protein
MLKRTAVLIGAVTAAGAIYGCAQKPQSQAAANEDKTFSITPASVKVHSGAVTGELKDLKVTETVEQGSGKVVTAPTLSGTLDLKNSSRDKTVRLVSGDLQYIGSDGKQIRLGKDRTAPVITFSSYGDSGVLNPGKETTQSLSVDFPARTLKAKNLKDIRIYVAYTESPYKDEALNFPVSIRGK